MRTWVVLSVVLTAAILFSRGLASASPIVLTESTGTCNHVTGCTIALPFSPVTGQVLLLDPNFFNLPLDVITFDSTTDTAVFASDNIDGFDDPGDTFGPPAPLTNQISLTEPSVETGPETLLYNPSPGDPGYGLDATGEPVSYGITSDSGSAPEPSSLLLLGAGVISLAAVRRRHGRRHP
jgi:PEP-CTERM motif-containing protein